jgi:hypothetical protein
MGEGPGVRGFPGIFLPLKALSLVSVTWVAAT